MSRVLSIHLEDELWERVHSQKVQPRQVVTEGLANYILKNTLFNLITH
jgi:hypothetical protein